MAAVDRRNPNLDDFVGLNWSCWVDRVNIVPSDAASSVDDSSKYGSTRSETMTLGKEDMHTFGHCPAHDEIYLVVCSHCGQVVKPQAFEKHCERRHGPLTKMCETSSTLAPQQRPRPARSPLNHSSSKEKQKDGRCHEASASSSAASPVHQHRPAKAQREAVSFPSVEKFPQENTPLPHHSSSSMPRPKVPPWHSGPLPPGHCSSSTSPSGKLSVQKPTAGQSSESHSPLRGTRTYSRIHKNNKKDCELNKQCGVLDPERKRPCSRELICNTDSIHQQEQKSLGRTKTVNQLAEEQKTGSAGGEMEQLLVKSKDKAQHLEAFEEKITTQGSKHNFNSNCHILSGQSENIPEEEGNKTGEVEAQPQQPFDQSLLSGEESEDDEQEEAIDLPATPWHPKPLGLCTFGCRTSGCSIFTFDRRLHHLRFALSAMLEHHVSTHLWKKMPQASPGLRSRHATPSTVRSPVRTGTRPSKSTGSLSLQSTSLGQLEPKTSQHKSHTIKPPSSSTPARLGPGQQRNPVGRASKAQLREEELIQDASTSQKAAKLLHSIEDQSPKYIRDPPLNEKGQPHVPSSQGPINGTFSHRSPRNRGKPPGIQQKVASYHHRGFPQKRKGSNESLPLSARSSKYQGLSSPSRSSLLAWNGENMGDARALGLEKRSNS